MSENAHPAKIGTIRTAAVGMAVLGAILSGVGFVMSGKARLGSDYILTTGTNQVAILAGQTSATVTVNTIADGVKEKAETATMTLQPGTGYQFGGGAISGKKSKKAKAPAATLTITD